MDRDDYQPKNVRNVPPALKVELVERAIADDVTIGDVVCRALAEVWSLEYEDSGLATQKDEAEGDQLWMRMPPAMARHIWETARLWKATESAVVISVLASMFGVDYELTRRRGRRKVVDEDAA